MSSNSAIETITLRGIRQNNLKNLDLELPTNQLIVITGVSGSGKSTLAFDTLYAEGQRRYVETFSAYARQFLDRMDKPAVDSVQGIPPAIAIDQTNPVRTSRSTVGTMTELNDYLKLVYPRLARLCCPGCQHEITRDSTASIITRLYAQLPQESRLHLCFPIEFPDNFSTDEVIAMLAAQGYTRLHQQTEQRVEVIQDRLRLNEQNRERLAEAIEAALHQGNGQILVYAWDEQDQQTPHLLRFSSRLQCPDCAIEFNDPVPSLFSFNSAIGACDTCRGFGRVIGVDFDLVIPDPHKTLGEGAIKPWQTPSFRECQTDLNKAAKRAGIPLDTAWSQLNNKQQHWVLAGEGAAREGKWYGVQGFFNWLESKAYKMHIRVLLSKYRAYTLCPDCQGSRLKPAALQWQLHDPQASASGNDRFTISELMDIPISQCAALFQRLQALPQLDEPTTLLLAEVSARLHYLLEVGLGYLSLSRQSRTLSGGEVQRINLTTALGTSLVNTLFVLDEPSIGLHTRDMDRLIKILLKLRDAGNTLVVVEHDAMIMRAADMIIDIGPGPGKDGGQLQFQGSPAELLANSKSLTARYLRGELVVATPEPEPEPGTGRQTRSVSKQALHIIGASEHNLKQLDIRIPLHQLVCVTGVSGSGKSTLIEKVVYRHLCRELGQALDEAPGACSKIKGIEYIDEVVLVDQSPIGKTTRSIPATYVGAFDVIRKRFVAEPLARERGYTPGTFSFNSGNGRCPTCSGNGFEQVEMQFLSDVYLRCSDCDGSRYRAEILEVKTLDSKREHAVSIADVLAMTVSEALDFFCLEQDIRQCLQPLVDVGLHYLQLGQAVPTLSGGEAQRLKLAAHLVSGKKQKGRHKLFLLDEPTTGLHFHDIKVLLSALRKLQLAGHSLVLIEHNLDVIAQADWIIDIGPEGGDAGGELVAAGTPAEFIASAPGLTAKALRDASNPAPRKSRKNPVKASSARSALASRHRVDRIQLHHAREHNLKNISLDIPLNSLVAITGISGSGKSTLAFDIVFAEGQRRYLESLNAYARQFVQPAARPDIDSIHGIPPTVAIEQRTSRGGRKSTVATQTEIYHYLRLIFVKLGVQHCPDCELPIQPQSAAAIQAQIMKTRLNQDIHILAPVVTGRKGIYKELAAWASNKGFARMRVDGQYVDSNDWPVLDRYKEHSIEICLGSCRVDKKSEKPLRALLDRALALSNGMLVIDNSGQPDSDTLFSTRRACPGCGTSFEELDPRLFSYNSRHGWCPSCFGTGETLADFDAEQSGEEADWLESTLPATTVCPSCQGSRLNSNALAVRFKQVSIAELTAMTVTEAAQRLATITLSSKEKMIAQDILAEILSRLHFLQKLGLDYLTLDRSAPSLSGGEAQRIRLAGQLGSTLQGVCYILDEPTIGLHARDNAKLIATLQELKNQGNSVLVVEHDEATIMAADHVIDIGPGAGVQGGEIMAQGSPAQIKRNKKSLTGQFLARPMRHPLAELTELRQYRPASKAMLQIRSASANNLRRLNVKIPLSRLVVISGVSGSGKSTLVNTVLHDNLQALLNIPGRRKKRINWQFCQEILGWEQLGSVLRVDQTPIGKTPRSCPATYIGIWDTIRKLFADTVDARLRGYAPGRFSFNVAGGRCENCAGNGMQKVEMNFLPDARIDCDACKGWRFNTETRTVHYKGKHIGEVLAMDIDTAVEFFAPVSSIHHPLKLLQDVGLGYLTLGQQSPSLSGGEAQRIKLVAELAKARPGQDLNRNKTPGKLYILDEPTVGLHMADVDKLLRVLHRLVSAGNSVIVVEHNLDVIAEADWLIDMGPEGGKNGGRIIAQGKPEKVAAHQSSATAAFLRPLLAS
ncbi:MAG: excinuclease ABC subunit UvrA [Pseudomonadales bacterium]|nr:excinuclease ABC subunit UvrA [Pseudomonadales bacterium]